ncbi:hypothetical protein [Hyphococcus sp.]|jgi:hypothetical protein|uniref:hypothetical protein n=1 Tax=Hyphococcus sp. TaxID=2038636 RepID=UPI003D120F2B
MSLRNRAAALAVLILPVVLSTAAAAPAAIAGAESKTFDGLYLAADVGRQDMVAGALIGGVDMLEQRQRIAGSFSAGYRKQIGGWVLGLEGGYGLVDGGLSIDDPAQQLSVEARNSSQIFYGAQIGVIASEKHDLLFFTYVSQVERSYELDIVSMGSAFSQTDKQGMLRFGGGLEKKISGPIHLRVSVGTARGKFSQPVAEPSRQLEFSGGVVFQF